eukprot:14366358-Alexandrium_andersonii.AAC.1
MWVSAVAPRISCPAACQCHTVPANRRPPCCAQSLSSVGGPSTGGWRVRERPLACAGQAWQFGEVPQQHGAGPPAA